MLTTIAIGRRVSHVIGTHDGASIKSTVPLHLGPITSFPLALKEAILVRHCPVHSNHMVYACGALPEIVGASSCRYTSDRGK